MTVSIWTVLGSGLTPCHEIISQKKGILVHLNRYLSLFSFRFACLQTSDISSWSLPHSWKPEIKMLSGILTTLTCCWIMHPFSSGTHLPLGLLRMVVLCISTYQMDKKKLLNMTFHLVSDCDSLSLHLLMWGISWLLVLVECCSM